MKKKIVFILITCLVLTAIVSALHFYNNKKAAEEMYNTVYDALIDYPVLSEHFAATVCHFEKDGVKYLVIQNEAETITGRRFASGETEYYYNGIRYRVFNNEVTETDSDVVDVMEVIHSAVASLLADETATYTYHKPSGIPLPLWVYPYDPGYLLIKRETYSDYMETMIYSDTESREVRWSIAHSEEDTVLYLYAAENLFSKPIIGIHGWGDIPEVVTKLIVM